MRSGVPRFTFLPAKSRRGPEIVLGPSAGVPNLPAGGGPAGTGPGLSGPGPHGRG